MYVFILLYIPMMPIYACMSITRFHYSLAWWQEYSFRTNVFLTTYNPHTYILPVKTHGRTETYQKIHCPTHPLWTKAMFSSSSRPPKSHHQGMMLAEILLHTGLLFHVDMYWHFHIMLKVHDSILHSSINLKVYSTFSVCYEIPDSILWACKQRFSCTQFPTC